MVKAGSKYSTVLTMQAGQLVLPEQLLRAVLSFTQIKALSHPYRNNPSAFLSAPFSFYSIPKYQCSNLRCTQVWHILFYQKYA